MSVGHATLRACGLQTHLLQCVARFGGCAGFAQCRHRALRLRQARRQQHARRLGHRQGPGAGARVRRGRLRGHDGGTARARGVSATFSRYNGMRVPSARTQACCWRTLVGHRRGAGGWTRLNRRRQLRRGDCGSLAAALCRAQTAPAAAIRRLRRVRRHSSALAVLHRIVCNVLPRCCSRPRRRAGRASRAAWLRGLRAQQVQRLQLAQR